MKTFNRIIIIATLIFFNVACFAKKKDLVLIPGLGFDQSVFYDFIKRNGSKYNIHAITIPGFGNTKAPLMPDSAHASYGLQTWTKNAVAEVIGLIRAKRLNKPVIIGHFVSGAQIALRSAIDFPDLIGGVIIVGAPAKFIPIVNNEAVEYPLQATVKYIDQYTGPKWFGTMTKEKFDQGNYLPEVYSLDPEVAKQLWRMSADATLPVYIRYLCEFFASDVTLETSKILCPVLILRAMFTPEVLNVDINNYIKPQFIDSWERMVKINPTILIHDVLRSATFIWKDQPEEFDEMVRKFVKKKLH